MDAASLVLKARYQGGAPSGAGEEAHLGTNPLLPREKLQVCELPPDGRQWDLRGDWAVASSTPFPPTRPSSPSPEVREVLS